MRYLFGFLCVCALGLMPLVGCDDAEGGGGTGGDGGSGGSAGSPAIAAAATSGAELRAHAQRFVTPTRVYVTRVPMRPRTRHAAAASVTALEVA